MATAMPAAKGLGPGDQSIVPDEGENFKKETWSHAVPCPGPIHMTCFGRANLVRCQFIANDL